MMFSFMAPFYDGVKSQSEPVRLHVFNKNPVNTMYNQATELSTRDLPRRDPAAVGYVRIRDVCLVLLAWTSTREAGVRSATR